MFKQLRISVKTHYTNMTYTTTRHVVVIVSVQIYTCQVSTISAMPRSHTARRINLSL